MNRALLALLFAASVVAVAQAPKTKPAPATASAVKPAAAPAKASATGALVANKDSKIYHRADCKAAAKIKDTHKTSFASAAEADKAGYKACKVCKP